MQDENTFGAGVARNRKLSFPSWSFGPGNGFCMPKNFETRLVRIVHEKKRNATVPLEIAERNVLAVADNVGKSKCPVIDGMKKACGAAAMLQVRPSCFAHSSHVEAVAGGDELALIGRQSVLFRALLGECLVRMPRSHLLLCGLDGWREG